MSDDTVRPGRLNRLARINSSERYLEIGTNRGDTFHLVEVESRVGVEPNPELEAMARVNGASTFNLSSNEFFSMSHQYTGYFDLIFLDGLHTFDQTFRDFCSTLALSNRTTIWLIDDTFPSNYAAALPDLDSAAAVRREMQIADNRWMGDVYKVVFAIANFFPTLSYATFSGHHQTVVWKEPRPAFDPSLTMKELCDMDYAGFLRHREWLNIGTDAEIFGRLSAGIEKVGLGGTA